MDYSQYKVIEFRRKFFKFLGAEISMFEPMSGMLIGFIKMKGWRITDTRVFTDKTMQREVARLGRRSGITLTPTYDVFDSTTGAVLTALRFRSLKTLFVRGHIDLLDAQGAQYGYVQETSSQLAIMRRWIGLVPIFGDMLEAVFAFTPQKFDIMYTPAGGAAQLVGRITHRKNPLIVKMSLDTTQAQVSLDPRVSIGICTILSIRDANKNA